MTTSPVVDRPPQLSAAEGALVAEFPTVPADVIHALVVRESRSYEGARVRDYIPLLVTRSVRARLRVGTDVIRLP